MIRDRDWRALIRYGANFFMLEKLAAVTGSSNLHIYAGMRGEALDDFMKTRNAPPRSILSRAGMRAASHGMLRQTASPGTTRLATRRANASERVGRGLCRFEPVVISLCSRVPFRFLLPHRVTGTLNGANAFLGRNLSGVSLFVLHRRNVAEKACQAEMKKNGHADGCRIRSPCDQEQGA